MVKDMTTEMKIVSTFLDQLKTIDPMYMGSLGIRIKSFSSDSGVDINMYFDASLLVINGKKYKGKSFVIVNCNIVLDTYSVIGKAFNSKWELKAQTEKYGNLDARQVYDQIFKMTSF